MTIVLTHFAGPAGDHNDRARDASTALAAVLGERLGLHPFVIGEPDSANPTNWADELARVRPAFHLMAAHLDALLAQPVFTVAAIGRCAVALATLPVIARRHPDAVVVWFDAHADLNTPQSTETGYLGGLALAGPLGLWESGFGGGLASRNVILVGARDFEHFEADLIDAGVVTLVQAAPNMEERLRRAVAGRPVYVHLDCDVLDPGIVPTDYSVAGGMSLAQLSACALSLAESEVIGIEIGELEVSVTHPSQTLQDALLIVSAIEPLLHRIERTPSRREHR